MANDTENLVFKLIADTKEFTSRIKGALDTAFKQVQDYQKKITAIFSKPLGSGEGNEVFYAEFSKLESALKKAEQQFNALKASTLGWREAAKQAGATSTEVKGVFEGLKDSAAQYGITLQQAAINAIASGQAQVKAVQQVLAANNKEVLSQQEIAQAINQLKNNLIAAGNAATGYSQSLSQATKQTQNLNKAAQQTSTSLSTMVKGALAFVGITSAFQIVSGIFEQFSNAAKTAIEFAQAEFSLAVQVRAANIATGNQSGTLEEWQDKVQKLRKELKIFSETDITNALAKVAGLTRAFKLDAEQQEKLLRISAVLATSIGEDLSQGLQDVVQYMGGSSVVLDKYNLSIRDTDKAVAAFQLGFTDKLQAGTAGLTSQELALASLETLFKNSGELVQAFGGYQETLPGQIKEVEAAIADQSKELGEIFDKTILGFKQVYLGFLQYLEAIANQPVVKKMLELVEGVIGDQQKRFSLGGARTIEPEEAGVDLKKNFFIGGVPDQLNLETGISFYSPAQLEGDKENIEAYQKYVEKTIADVKAALRSADNSLTREPDDRKPGDEPAGPAEQPLPDEDFMKAQEQLGKAILDADKDRTRQAREAIRDRNQAIEDEGQKLIEELEDLEKEYGRKLQDLDKDTGNKRSDARRKYFQDLADLERDEGEKREEIINDGNNRITEIYEDYYRKLKELDAQYYFDLRDAVAENDAVAVKRLERKYALDRQKLDDALQDKLNDEQGGVDDRLEELERETDERRQELRLRYERELEDIKIDAARRRDELNIWHKREQEDLQLSNQRKLAEIEENYQEQLEVIKLHFDDRLADIADKLAEDYDLEKTAVRKLFSLYDEYYGEGGKLWELVSEFYEHQEELAGEFSDSISDLDDLENDRENLNVTTTSNGSTMSVVISGDGSISDSTLDRLVEEIAEQLADSIEQVVVTRGGSSGR